MFAIAAAEDTIRGATQQRAECCLSFFWHQQLQCWVGQQAGPAEVAWKQDTLGLLNPFPTTLPLVVLLVQALEVLCMPPGFRERRSSRLQTTGL